MTGPGVWWETKAPAGRHYRWEFAEDFTARGMERLYRREDRFGSWIANMGVWRTKDGRIFARFWSRSSDVDGCSYEVFGLKVPALTKGQDVGSGEQWIPRCLRDEYENWVTAEWQCE
jgi:hypothetical protein